MSDTQPLPLSIQPVISYPSEAKVGETYMMTIDLETPGGEWLYEEEEYPIDLMLDTLPLFRCKAVGEPSLVLHRFGGTYGAAKFLLTAAQEEMQGKIRVTLVNKWGVPIRVLSLDQISITQGVTDNRGTIGSYQRVISVPQQPNRNYWRNPYIIGRSTHEPEKFFGREDLFQFIEDNLNADTKILLLYGQRRMGKSSAIKQFARKIDPQKFVFVCFDLQEYSNSSISDILYNLAEKIAEELELDSNIIPLPSEEQFQSNLDIFSDDFLPRVYQQLGNKKLVLVLDEFDLINIIDENNFFKYVQSLLNKQTKLFIIPVLGRSRDDLEYLFELFNNPPSYEFGLLNELGTRRLITKPAKGMLKYEEDAIKAIFRLSSGHPSFTQAICFNLFIEARIANKTTVNREDVERIVDKTIESVEGGLAWLWDGLSINEKVVFSAVAEVQQIAIEDKQSFPEDPLFWLTNYGIIQTEELIKVPKRLVDKGYLDDTERRVKIELVRRWLVQYHPLNKEIFELQRIEQEVHLQRCTVRLNVASSQGTGFFVAPNWILTCAHVVESAKDNPVQVFWKAGNQNYTAKVTQLWKYPLDLALLQLDEDCLDHPCVELDDTEPKTNDDLYIFGYPKNSEVDYSQGDSASFKYEGISFKQDIILYKLKQGQVISGFSGSPLLNLLTGKVCGIVHLSRDEGNDLGGRAVSAQVIVQQFPEIALLNKQFHQPKPKGDNPFEYGPPVSPQRFYGRRREILEIKNRIGAISSQCVNLVGLRRNGKTSLLRYIKERISEFCLPEQKPLVVFLDLTNGNFHTPEGIIEGLRRGIHKLTGNFPWSKEDNEDGYAVEDGLQFLVDQGYRLIILLDEFEAIASKKDRLELFQDWGEDWRSKACAGLLTMVIASKRPLNEVYKTLGMDSPFDNIFSTTILGALEEEAWQNIIQKGQKEFLLSSAVLQWVDELAGGLPYYVQMAGAMLWQNKNQEIAKNEFNFQAKPRFEELWKDLTKVEHLALRYELGESNLPIPDLAIVDRLQRHGLLRKNGGLFSSVFAEFVKGQR